MCVSRGINKRVTERQGYGAVRRPPPLGAIHFMSTAFSVERLAAHNLMQLALHTFLAVAWCLETTQYQRTNNHARGRGTTAAPDGGPCFHRLSDQPRKALFPGSFHRLPRTSTRPSRASGVPSSFRSSRRVITARHVTPAPPARRRETAAVGSKPRLCSTDPTGELPRTPRLASKGLSCQSSLYDIATPRRRESEPREAPVGQSAACHGARRRRRQPPPTTSCGSAPRGGEV